MISIGDALQRRIEAYKERPIEETLKWEKADYEKRWAKGVQFFQKKINEDRRREGRKFPPMSFIAVRQKVVHIRDLEDLRWFYFKCIRYSKTKDAKTGKWNTFSRCFFGALKPR